MGDEVNIGTTKPTKGVFLKTVQFLLTKQITLSQHKITFGAYIIP